MMTDEELVAELEQVFADGGWQGLADRPTLVERLVVLTPHLPDREADLVRQLYRATQAGYRVKIVNDPE